MSGAAAWLMMMLPHLLRRSKTPDRPKTQLEELQERAKRLRTQIEDRTYQHEQLTQQLARIPEELAAIEGMKQRLIDHLSAVEQAMIREEHENLRESEDKLQ